MVKKSFDHDSLNLTHRLYFKDDFHLCTLPTVQCIYCFCEPPSSSDDRSLWAVALPTATAWNSSVTLSHLPRHLAWSVDSCIGGACLHVLFPSRLPSLLYGAGSSALELHMYQHASSVVEGVYTVPTGLNCMSVTIHCVEGLARFGHGEPSSQCIATDRRVAESRCLDTCRSRPTRHVSTFAAVLPAYGCYKRKCPRASRWNQVNSAVLESRSYNKVIALWSGTNGLKEFGARSGSNGKSYGPEGKGVDKGRGNEGWIASGNREGCYQENDRGARLGWFNGEDESRCIQAWPSFRQCDFVGVVYVQRTSGFSSIPAPMSWSSATRNINGAARAATGASPENGLASGKGYIWWFCGVTPEIAAIVADALHVRVGVRAVAHGSRISNNCCAFRGVDIDRSESRYERMGKYIDYCSSGSWNGYKRTGAERPVAVSESVNVRKQYRLSSAAERREDCLANDGEVEMGQARAGERDQADGIAGPGEDFIDRDESRRSAGGLCQLRERPGAGMMDTIFSSRRRIAA
ncbi:hypothetical protein B0H13DRAFT_1859668 [Mycena leptocephala]|nr:hypothetical protein B0H13DRAFT_1859668 [Mycena leptocephala]